VRGVALVKHAVPEGWTEAPPTTSSRRRRRAPVGRDTVVRLPSFEHRSRRTRGLCPRLARAARESNPGNARALVQRHGDREVWLTPPPIPLTTAEMDAVYELPYARAPHPAYGDAKIPPGR
jgi:hypothetical protein